MALPSARQQTTVDPDKGIYVEMHDIMEVRYSSEDPDFHMDPEDMLDFQSRVTSIPDNFCHKDKSTTEQAFFFCLVCNCDLKNLRPLRDHVLGNKHIRKACEKKRQVMGMPQEPQNAPRKKEQKKERPRVDVGQTLEEKLKDCGEPAIGLEFITEFTNPKNYKDHPMYTCCLEGCKSAWGTSDDIYHHVKNHKHQKNFFKKQHPEDGRILGMPKDQLLIKAAEYEEETGGAEERDYTVIMRVQDYEKYMELRDRPDDWSEKKAALGIVGKRANSNYEPLGDRRKKRKSEPSQFDEESWANWEPPSKKEAYRQVEQDFITGIKDMKDLVADFKGKKGDKEYDDIKFYQEQYNNLLSLFKNNNEPEFAAKVSHFESDFEEINNELIEKTEAEDRAMKEISRLMAELEDEIQMYYSHRNTNKHKNIKDRIKELTAKVSGFKPTSSQNQEVKKELNARLYHLWKEFEERSESVVEILERQIDPAASASNKSDSEMTKSQRSLVLRNNSIERYKDSLKSEVVTFLQTYKGKFGDDNEIQMFAKWVIESKVIGPEVNIFTKNLTAHKVRSWEEFKVSNDTVNNVKKYLIQKMERYNRGDVYKA